MHYIYCAVASIHVYLPEAAMSVATPPAPLRVLGFRQVLELALSCLQSPWLPVACSGLAHCAVSRAPRHDQPVASLTPARMHVIAIKVCIRVLCYRLSTWRAVSSSLTVVLSSLPTSSPSMLLRRMSSSSSSSSSSESTETGLFSFCGRDSFSKADAAVRCEDSEVTRWAGSGVTFVDLASYRGRVRFYFWQ